jgi:hypothetical protein
MITIIIICVLIFLGLLWLKEKSAKVLKEDFDPAAPLEVEIKTFNKHNDERKHEINFARLSKHKGNEHVLIYHMVADAAQKQKKYFSYKDLYDSPKMLFAFKKLVNSPNVFFDELVMLSSNEGVPEQSNFHGHSDNENNVGLHIEQVPTKTEQYVPMPPNPTWKYIERSRGKY